MYAENSNFVDIIEPTIPCPFISKMVVCGVPPYSTKKNQECSSIPRNIFYHRSLLSYSYVKCQSTLDSSNNPVMEMVNSTTFIPIFIATKKNKILSHLPIFQFSL
eukprot:TRINITY_DN2521_c0_g1_i2.p2 TRINITY_DN2521_c0_g1~~TRINITY_DN2521_c0_g1_i2.p2  ORF type:complete len:105 (+),score=3.10 TRINITY_DN2521_c0_g1_i2:664-978(+)